ncbi:MAG: ABC transporter substrate-binding protein [Devosia sp.]|uniref:ABC transporter substrate-binding protein n=1 Tax=Devosia sp. TaxID=1871048 RepID=UPI001A448BB3|nr:ABC transporter substrate-binding protein [Devosia sp.]MBL8596407.1 ABC transporter substrate-binding protein [Devosia sp.]
MALRTAVAAFALALSFVGIADAAPRTDLRIGLVLEPPALDPTAGAAAAIDEVVYQNVFEGLTRIDETGAVQPALASSWDVSADGLSYTFHLVEGATFHDGTTFDADDVVFTYGRITAADSVNAQKALYAGIDSVTAVNTSTVELKLKGPDGLFLFNVGRGDAVIVAPESAANNANTPIGTGPFKFVNWQKGADLTLEQYAGYWGTKPALTKVTYVFINDAAARVNALLAGSIDGINNTDASTLPVFKADPRFKVVVGSTEGETLLVQNNAKAPFSDLKVRQAIAHSLDRAEIIAGASSGYGTPIGSHFPPHSKDYVDLTGTYPYDLDAARKLLAEAGYPDGFSATLKLPPVPYATVGGQIVASQLAKVGIKLTQVNLDWNQWLSDVFTNKDYDLTIISHVEPFDIGIYADPNYYFGYNDPDFQAIMKQLNETTDEAARKELLIAAQKRLAEQAVNGYLFELAQTGVWSAKLEGMWQNAPVEGVVLSGIRWTE